MTLYKEPMTSGEVRLVLRMVEKDKKKSQPKITNQIKTGNNLKHNLNPKNRFKNKPESNYHNKNKTFQYKTISLRLYKIYVWLWMVVPNIKANKVTAIWYRFLKKYLIEPCNKEFHINDNYIITDGEFKNKKFGDIIKKTTSLCMLYVNENLDFEVIK